MRRIYTCIDDGDTRLFASRPLVGLLDLHCVEVALQGLDTGSLLVDSVLKPFSGWTGFHAPVATQLSKCFRWRNVGGQLKHRAVHAERGDRPAVHFSQSMCGGERA